MEMESDRKSHKLNARTFAIRHGDAILVTVPVLIYQNKGTPAQKAGFDYMNRLIEQGMVDQFKTVEITASWCSMDPHNSEANSLSEDDDDD